MDYSEGLRQWREVTGIKIGDTVKCIADAPDWIGGWIPEMMYVGYVGKVSEFPPSYGGGYGSVHLDDRYWWPYWVLVKVEDDD